MSKTYQKNEKIERKTLNNKILRNELKTIQEKSIKGCRPLRTLPTKKVKKSNGKTAVKKAEQEGITEKNPLAKELRESEEMNVGETIHPTRKRGVKKPMNDGIEGNKDFIIQKNY